MLAFLSIINTLLIQYVKCRYTFDIDPWVVKYDCSIPACDL